MALRASTKLKNALLAAISSAFDYGTIYIYSGTQPANANAAPTGTLLAMVTVGAGAFTHGAQANGLRFDAPAGGVLTKRADQVWQYKGIADGFAGWFRFIPNAADSLAADNTETYARLDGRIAAAGGEMTLSNLNVVTNVVGTVDACELDFSTWL
ncbi:MAG: hypothetical protein ABTQ93_14855 [Candidatus Competibacter denitrificans]